MDCRDKPGNDSGWGSAGTLPSPSSSRNSRERLSGIGEPRRFGGPLAPTWAPRSRFSGCACGRDDDCKAAAYGLPVVKPGFPRITHTQAPASSRPSPTPFPARPDNRSHPVENPPICIDSVSNEAQDHKCSAMEVYDNDPTDPIHAAAGSFLRTDLRGG